MIIARTPNARPNLAALPVQLRGAYLRGSLGDAISTLDLPTDTTTLLDLSPGVVAPPATSGTASPSVASLLSQAIASIPAATRSSSPLLATVPGAYTAPPPPQGMTSAQKTELLIAGIGAFFVAVILLRRRR